MTVLIQDCFTYWKLEVMYRAVQPEEQLIITLRCFAASTELLIYNCDVTQYVIGIHEALNLLFV